MGHVPASGKGSPRRSSMHVNQGRASMQSYRERAILSEKRKREKYHLQHLIVGGGAGIRSLVWSGNRVSRTHQIRQSSLSRLDCDVCIYVYKHDGCFGSQSSTVRQLSSAHSWAVSFSRNPLCSEPPPECLKISSHENQAAGSGAF